MKRIVSAILFVMLLTGMLCSASRIMPVGAVETIYIRADGSVDPPSAPIQRNGDNYVLTDDINCSGDGIVIQRSNMILDGANHTIHGQWGSIGGYHYGTNITGVSNVAVTRFGIRNFYRGMGVDGSSNITVADSYIYENNVGVDLHLSSNISITGTCICRNSPMNYGATGIDGSSLDNIIIRNCTFGGNVGSSLSNVTCCTLSENSIADRLGFGVGGSNCTVSGNKFTTYYYVASSMFSKALVLGGSFNEVYGNTFRGFLLYPYLQGGPSVFLSGSSNKVYHNNFMGNITYYALIDWTNPAYANSWDDGYPSGGNYWSNASSVDDMSGQGQDEFGSDGIIDVPCVINENNTDHYPLTVPWGPVSEYHSGTWEESPNFTPLGWRNITYIVVHVMDGHIDSAINWFKDPMSNVSAHYLISQEGEIVQMVREKDIAWHAGNWTYNQQSIGIEHEDQGSWNTPNWVPEKLYQASAALVRNLCEKYGIPKDRMHIIGHNEVPGVVKPCPGPYWDWGYFMGLVNGTLAPRTFVVQLDSTDYPVSVLSNSTASDFIFTQVPPVISINFTAPSGTHGFCNLTVPQNLLKGNPWTIEINGNSSTPFTQTDNTTHTFLSFTFTHSSTINVKVEGTWVIPEFSSFLILSPLFMIATLLAVIIYKRETEPWATAAAA